MNSKKSKAEAVKRLPPLGCPKCHDAGWADGWILVLGDGGQRSVKKCDCLVAREAAKAGAA